MSIDYTEVFYFECCVMSDEWDKVIELYKKNKIFHELKVKKRGTALHVAVSNGVEHAVKELVDAILMHNVYGTRNDDHPLRKLDERGGTPLHIAAYRGFTSMCECIIGKNGERMDLIWRENDDGETPVFWAVQGHRNKTFVYLRQFLSDQEHDVNIVMDNNRTTILHVAIRREMFDLANIIMHYYGIHISTQKNSKCVTPLEELATRSSAFENGNYLAWWEQIFYDWFHLKLQDTETEVKSLEESVKKGFPIKLQDAETKLKSLEKSVNKGSYLLEARCHSTCCTCCTCMFTTRPVAELDATQSCDISIPDDGELETEDKVRSTFDQISKWPIISLLDLAKIKIIKTKRTYATRLLTKFMEKFNESYWDGESADYWDNDNKYAALIDKEREEEKECILKMKKEKHGTSDKIMEKHNSKLAAKHDIVKITQELISQLPITSDKKGILLEAVNNIETKLLAEEARDNTTYLVAAKHGIAEITGGCVKNRKSVIHDRNSNNENVLLLAVKYRQPQIVEGLKNDSSIAKDIFESLRTQVDKKENTMLHLAAYTSLNKETTWRISGPAMQMMWDVKWYKYIQGIVPEYFKHRINAEEKTPGEIFKEEHENLLQKSTDWLKDTAESCSVVAALIAGLSFATSGSVPGGNKDSGKPTLEGQPAFEGFAISSLVGLYFSGLALIMFLSILTSRKQIEDFTRNLPAKLLGGLTSLFISIVAMFISFCAGHFFVLTDKYGKHDILFYLLIVFSFPVIFYGAMQLPLYIDLLQVICKKVPPPSIKGVHL